MITKNSFYGAYLITMNKSDDDAVSILSVLKDVEFAWEVVESLQEKPVQTAFVTDDDVDKLIKEKLIMPGVYDGDLNSIDPMTGNPFDHSGLLKKATSTTQGTWSVEDE